MEFYEKVEHIRSFVNNYEKNILRANKFDESNLSIRELECLYLISLGKNCKEIARELSISNRTVEAYIAKIKIKTGCYLKSDLVVLMKKLMYKIL